MNKKQQIQLIKPAMLLSVALDLNITTKISDAAGDIIDELYTLPTMKQSTFLQKLAYQFENTVTIDKMTVAQLLLDTLRDTKLRGNRFDRLIKLLEDLTIWDRRNQDLHHKVESIIRYNYKQYANQSAI